MKNFNIFTLINPKRWGGTGHPGLPNSALPGEEQNSTMRWQYRLIGTKIGTEIRTEIGTEIGAEIGTEIGTKIGTEIRKKKTQKQTNAS